MAAAGHRPLVLLLAGFGEGWGAATGAGLHARGWSVVWAVTADAAAPALRRTLPDVVVLDGALGEAGARALRELRAAPATALVPVVVVAAEGIEPAAFMRSGAQVLERMPVTVDDLDAAARRALAADIALAAPPPAALADPKRLGLLEESGLLDDAGDALLEQIATLAGTLLPAASARVSLVTADRQVFAARVDARAMRGDRPERSLPLGYSLCQWAVATREPLVVGDARADPLLGVNRSVTELGAVAYLGAPLLVEGEALGTLCVLDDEPRDWMPEHLDILDDLATAAASQVRLRLLRPDDPGGRDAAADGITALARLVDRYADGLPRPSLPALAAAFAHFGGRVGPWVDGG